MDIADEIKTVVETALSQGYYVPAVSLNNQAYTEFTTLPITDFDVDGRVNLIRVFKGDHADRLRAVNPIKVQY